MNTDKIAYILSAVPYTEGKDIVCDIIRRNIFESLSDELLKENFGIILMNYNEEVCFTSELLFSKEDVIRTSEIPFKKGHVLDAALEKVIQDNVNASEKRIYIISDSYIRHPYVNPLLEKITRELDYSIYLLGDVSESSHLHSYESFGTVITCNAFAKGLIESLSMENTEKAYSMLEEKLISLPPENNGQSESPDSIDFLVFHRALQYLVKGEAETKVGKNLFAVVKTLPIELSYLFLRQIYGHRLTNTGESKLLKTLLELGSDDEYWKKLAKYKNSLERNKYQ